MTEETANETPTKPGIKDGKQTPRYRVLRRVALITDRRTYEPGAIVDLSHLPQSSIQWFLDNGFYETADGEPANDPAAPAKPCKNC